MRSFWLIAIYYLLLFYDGLAAVLESGPKLAVVLTVTGRGEAGA